MPVGVHKERRAPSTIGVSGIVCPIITPVNLLFIGELRVGWQTFGKCRNEGRPSARCKNAPEFSLEKPDDLRSLNQNLDHPHWERLLECSLKRHWQKRLLTPINEIFNKHCLSVKQWLDCKPTAHYCMFMTLANKEPATRKHMAMTSGWRISAHYTPYCHCPYYDCLYYGLLVLPELSLHLMPLRWTKLLGSFGCAKMFLLFKNPSLKGELCTAKFLQKLNSRRNYFQRFLRTPNAISRFFLWQLDTLSLQISKFNTKID